MEARFRIFKAPFYFVGWLAPAYGIDKVNPNGITLQNTQETDTQYLADFSVYAMHHIYTTK